MVDYFENNHLFMKKCKENECILKNASRDYYIVDEDSLKNNICAEDKSVDCILINKKPVNSLFNLIFCELGNNKSYKDIKEKASKSGKHMCGILEKYGININKIYCFHLGSIKNLHSKQRKPITICSASNVRIESKSCQFDFDELNLN